MSNKAQVQEADLAAALAAEDIEQYVADLVKPWVEFRGHHGSLAALINARVEARIVTIKNTALINLAAAKNQAAESDRLRQELKWVSEQRWNEDADLDDICTRADRAISQ